MPAIFVGKAKQASQEYEKSRKFKSEWKKEFLWVIETKDGKAKCTVCNSTLDPKKSRLQEHETSAKHQKNLPKCNMPKITDTKDVIIVSSNDNVKIAEMNLAAEIAVHCPLAAIDHIGEVITSNSVCTKKDCANPLSELKIHRTKCTKIVTNVIGKYLKDELKKSLPEYYSVMIDEWSDLSYKPHLAIIVSYCEKLTGTIKQSFLGIKELEKTDSDTIFATLKSTLDEFNLKLENCIGYASDGAAVVSGKNNSVFTRMKQHSPNIYQIKCICHSIAKCAEHAFNRLPSCLGFLLKAVPKWFSKSNLRKSQYMQLFNQFEGSDMFSTPFQKYAETRWLVRGKICRNLLNNWEILKEYFNSIVADLRGDQKFNCMLIIDNLNQNNHSYFKFVTPIVETCERANLLFQKEKIDPQTAFEEVSILFQSVTRRITNSRGDPLVLELTNFGYEFEQMNPTDEVKARCRAFLDELSKQLSDRVQINSTAIMSLSLLYPKLILSANKPHLENLPENPLKSGNVEELYI